MWDFHFSSCFLSFFFFFFLSERGQGKGKKMKDYNVGVLLPRTSTNCTALSAAWFLTTQSETASVPRYVFQMTVVNDSH